MCCLFLSVSLSMSLSIAVSVAGTACLCQCFLSVSVFVFVFTAGGGARWTAPLPCLLADFLFYVRLLDGSHSFDISNVARNALAMPLPGDDENQQDWDANEESDSTRRAGLSVCLSLSRARSLNLSL